MLVTTKLILSLPFYPLLVHTRQLPDPSEKRRDTRRFGIVSKHGAPLEFLPAVDGLVASLSISAPQTEYILL